VIVHGDISYAAGGAVNGYSSWLMRTAADAFVNSAAGPDGQWFNENDTVGNYRLTATMRTATGRVPLFTALPARTGNGLIE
jgi:hypothetical protein